MYKIFLIAGEESGDIHSANMIRQLRKLTDFSLYGTGGPRLKELGQKQFFNSDEMTIIGFDGIIKNFGFILRMFDVLKEKIIELNPDIIILIDYPGFNLRLAKKISKLDIPIVYYIAPQVWAWHYSRVKIIKKHIRKVFCILPFEEKIFLKEGIDAQYVGNPILDNINLNYPNKKDFFLINNLDIYKKTIGILPGSRKREVLNLMPEIIKAYEKLKNKFQFVLCKAESIDNDLIEIFVKDTDIKITHLNYDTIAYSDLVWVCSGTASLETAFFEKPMIIMYKVGCFTEFVGRLLIKTNWIGLPNIVAQKKIVPELLQDNMNSKNIVIATEWLEENFTVVKHQLAKVSELFSRLNPSKQVAKEIFSLLNKKNN
jgi:lipid-A-disaccharide synthase